MNLKKMIRKNFRDKVFARAKYRCQGPGCSFISSLEKADKELDSHHIQNRNSFLNGGYVAENGIALCDKCHIKAEIFHSTGMAFVGFSPDDLYRIINSSFEKAKIADMKKVNHE